MGKEAKEDSEQARLDTGTQRQTGAGGPDPVQDTADRHSLVLVPQEECRSKGKGGQAIEDDGVAYWRRSRSLVKARQVLPAGEAPE